MLGHRSGHSATAVGARWRTAVQETLFLEKGAVAPVRGPTMVS
jgi:hypothetical protein